eukprot:scaffold10139_cov112-Isochrysis_galbana.AAC.1
MSRLAQRRDPVKGGSAPDHQRHRAAMVDQRSEQRWQGAGRARHHHRLAAGEPASFRHARLLQGRARREQQERQAGGPVPRHAARLPERLRVELH